MKEMKEMVDLAKKIEVDKNRHDFNIKSHLQQHQIAAIKTPEQLTEKWAAFDVLYQDAQKDPVQYFRNLFTTVWDEEEEVRKRELSS